MLKRRLKEPFGKAGLTVAILALVMALVGGAYAAGGLTSSQEKQVKKIAQKYAGKPGATGPAGAAGTNGTNGTNGKDGAPGANGENGKSAEAGTPFTGTKTIGSVKCENGGVPVKSASPETAVCNGKNGTTGFTKTLPSGETETGVWSAAFTATAAGQESLDPISFNIPLEKPLGTGHVHFIGKEEGEGEAHQSGIIPSKCKGTFANPQAVAGELCAFAPPLIINAVKGSTILSTVFLNPKTLEGETAGTNGTLLGVHSEAAGPVLIFGSWAVTAP
jgi:hypothetical protein